jgi:hypothetical protein
MMLRGPWSWAFYAALGAVVLVGIAAILLSGSETAPNSVVDPEQAAGQPGNPGPTHGWGPTDGAATASGGNVGAYPRDRSPASRSRAAASPAGFSSKLIGTTADADNPMAWFVLENGATQVVRIGGVVEQARLVSVAADSATLDLKGKKLVVPLSDVYAGRRPPYASASSEPATLTPGAARLQARTSRYELIKAYKSTRTANILAAKEGEPSPASQSDPTAGKQ